MSAKAVRIRKTTFARKSKARPHQEFQKYFYLIFPLQVFHMYAFNRAMTFLCHSYCLIAACIDAAAFSSTSIPLNKTPLLLLLLPLLVVLVLSDSGGGGGKQHHVPRRSPK